MALSIPTFENPYDPSTPFQNAYAWTANLALDVFHGLGRITLNVNPNENAWQGSPIGQVSINLGEVLVPASQDEQGDPVPEVRIKTLLELMTDPEFAQAYAVIGSKLYAEAIKHPKFAGATQV